MQKLNWQSAQISVRCMSVRVFVCTIMHTETSITLTVHAHVYVCVKHILTNLTIICTIMRPMVPRGHIKCHILGIIWKTHTHTPFRTSLRARPPVNLITTIKPNSSSFKIRCKMCLWITRTQTKPMLPLSNWKLIGEQITKFNRKIVYIWSIRLCWMHFWHFLDKWRSADSTLSTQPL